MTHSNYVANPLCAINFNAFRVMKEKIEGVEEILLLAKLKFHQQNTKLIKFGLPVIARSRKDISSWFGFSERKTDSLLSALVKKGLLKKTVGTFYGTKKLFLSVSTEIHDLPINFTLLETLIEETGSLKAALVFSKIAFKFELAELEEGGLKYCYLKKESLSEWAGISIRTLDSILNSLSKKGLIIKKNLVSCGKRQAHFHIPKHVIEILIKRTTDAKKTKEESIEKVIHRKNCRIEPAKVQRSIKIRTKTKEAINNTIQEQPRMEVEAKQDSKEGDINFSFKTLSDRQKRYTRGALNQTIKRHSLVITNSTELLNEVLFSLEQKEQLKGVMSFKHAVSRIMLIIKDGNWRTPIGYSKYSDLGAKQKRQNIDREKSWKADKAVEIAQSETLCSIQGLVNERAKQSENNAMTEKAFDIAKSILGVSKKATQCSGISTDSSLSTLLDLYTSQLKSLFESGADKPEIMRFLKDNY